MNLEEFRLLDNLEGDQNAARCEWVGHVIAGQSNWLRRGENLTGPIGRFHKGRTFTDADIQYADDQFTPIGVVPDTVQAFTIKATIEQVCDGHPWLNLGRDANDANYYHLYTVELRHAFGDLRVGDLVTMIYHGQPFKIAITQQMIDETTYALIRLALSK
jgi:hypothetical protein